MSATAMTDEGDGVNTKFRVRNADVFYGDNHAIKSNDIDIDDRSVTAFIGPSGCGKSTFLRCLNRMNDTIEICRVTGDFHLMERGPDGADTPLDIYAKDIDPVQLRARVGMVFQKPNPFPKSIYDNVAYGPRIHGLTRNRAEMNDLVEESLQRAGLWNEVKDRLDQPGTGLSGGQQQRLCIARAIATQPEVLLMDEPCSALDPNATDVVEQLIEELGQSFCIVIVTHSMQQAFRISKRTAFFYLGEMLEYGTTEQIFQRPQLERTKNYVSGRFG